MARPIIEVTKLSKSYSIGRRESYGSLRDEIMQALTAPFRRKGPSGSDESPDTIWALKDVSFEVEEGEVLGIIGRNGAGKSTLLKILSRITEPTGGRITMRGRVASLLEVGTGFHPELTGRENIFLNGALLGMSSAEIRSKFDEIVAFSEIEKFLDTPVKRYSSGMYVRLAFAVAAHLEPEILVVDEVLAVGDAEFQKKCLGKMGDVARGGRTVLFVSHNMGAVSELCTKCIMLDGGVIAYDGGVRKAISRYTVDIVNNKLSLENCMSRYGSGGIRLIRVWITNSRNEITQSVIAGESIVFNLEAEVSAEYQHKNNIVAGFGVDTLEGRRILTCVSSWIKKDIQTKGDRLIVRCKIQNLPVVPDRYLISASVIRFETLDCAEHCESFEVQWSDISISRGGEYGLMDVQYDFEAPDV